MMNDDMMKGAVGLGGTALGFLAKWFWDRLKKDKEDTDAEVKLLRKDVHQLTIAITELRVELKHITQALKVIPELEKDVNGLGRSVRTLASQINSQD